MQRILFALGGSIVFSTIPAMAQTRFAWPDTAVNVAQYTRASECLAATTRVRGTIESVRNRQTSPDTMPYHALSGLDSLPTAARGTAQLCASRWPATTASLDEFAPLFSLYLAAKQDADASTLLARRLAALDSKHQDRERTAVIDSVVDFYMLAQPVHLAAAESLLITRARHATDRIARLAIYFRLMQQAGQVNDTIRARRAAMQIIAIADSLTPTERESEAFQNSGGQLGVLYAAVEATGQRVVLDSLRKSTSAYARLIQLLWAKATGMRLNATPMAIGQRAAPIAADFWFPSDSAHAPRPTPGRVALVVFLDRAQCLDRSTGVGAFASDERRDEGGECWPTSAALRRLAARFPALEITVVAGTHGYFLYAPPQSPVDEASLIAKWSAAHQMPGVLAVSSTRYFRIEAPDNRRIEKPDSNFTRYTFGKSWTVGDQGTYFLVDEDGVIVDASVDIFASETKVGELIDILLHRHDKGGSRGSF